MKMLIALLVCTVWASVRAQTPPSCLCFEELTGARNFRNPLILKSANDTTRRKFVGEQLGFVWIFEQGSSTRLPTPFLDLSQVVITSSRSGDERGLLQMVFHPNFRSNRKLYVYYTRSVSGDLRTHLVELQTMSSNPNRVDPNSYRLILDIDQPYGNHNGGDMVFGDDGYLYLSIGDGGSAGDPGDRAMNKATLLGKLIRIDVNRRDAGLEYAIPRDNPFVGESGSRGEIWAIGLRNPWRIDFDEGDPNNMAGTRGRIFVADVGQNWIEEVDLMLPTQKGLNYGWSAFEGTECYKDNLCDTLTGDIKPIAEYNHQHGRSITGGHVYRGCSNPNLQGLYFYSDYSTGRIWYLRQSGQTWTDTEISGCTNTACRAADSGLIGNVARFDRWLSFGEDEDGELYILGTDQPSPTNTGGRVYRIVDISNRQPVCPGGPTRP